MQQLFAYIKLQSKRCLKSFGRSVGILGGALVIIIILLTLMGRLLAGNDTLSLVRVGVMVPEDELAAKYVVSFISSMDSVKSICEFDYVDEETAIAGFKSGVYAAAVVLPENFYHDVQVGLNPPALIYFPDNPSLVGSLFKELLMTGVSYLQTAESGVYAVLDVSRENETRMSTADIGNSIALSYVNALFSRDKLFTDKSVSALGDLSIISYYFIAGMVLLLMISGLTFSSLYGKGSKAVDDKLRVNGMNYLSCAVSRMIIMLPFIYLTGVIIYLAGVFISNRFGYALTNLSGRFFIYLLIVSLTMSVYFGIIYMLAGNSRSGVLVLLIINIIGAVCSGLILPEAYLAPWVGKIGNVLPMKYWVKLICIGIYGGAV